MRAQFFYLQRHSQAVAWQLAGDEQGPRLVRTDQLELWEAMDPVLKSQPASWERHPRLPVLYRREGHGTRIILFASEDELERALALAQIEGVIPTRPVPPAARRHFQGLEH